MIHYKEQQRLNFLELQLFNLVADIESYPQFLPWCKSVRLLTDHRFTNNDQQRYAEVSVSFGPFQASYSCQIMLNEYHDITVTLVDGPLKILNTSWIFEPVSTNLTDVTINLNFAMKSLLLQKIVEPIFNDVARHMMTAFKQRADYLYPKS